MKAKWRYRESINVQELRVVAATARRLSMSREAWRKRVLIFTDSTATLGAVQKGRTSSYPMLRQCRTICALSLVLQIWPRCRYVESERNWSDGPSRGLKIGAAADTVLLHAYRTQLLAAKVRAALAGGRGRI